MTCVSIMFIKKSNIVKWTEISPTAFNKFVFTRNVTLTFTVVNVTMVTVAMTRTLTLRLNKTLASFTHTVSITIIRTVQKWVQYTVL